MALKGTLSDGNKTITYKGSGEIAYDNSSYDTTDTSKLLIGGTYNDSITVVDASSVSTGQTKIGPSDKLVKILTGKGADKITPSENSKIESINSGAGNDEINVKGKGSTLNIDSGAGNDKVTLATAADTIILGAGNDTFHQTSGKTASVAAGAGNDSLKVDNGATVTNVFLDASNDVVEISGEITNIDASKGGNNQILIKTDGKLTSYIGGKGVDSIKAEAQTTTLTLGSIDLAGGNDYVQLGSSVIANSIKSTVGKNIIEVKSGATLQNYTGGSGIDSILANGQLGSINLGEGNNAGNNVVYIGTGATFVGVTDSKTKGNDKVTVAGGTVENLVLGAGNDEVSLNAGTINNLELGEGNDVVYVGNNVTSLNIKDFSFVNKNSDKIFVDSSKFNAENVSIDNGTVTIKLTTDGSVASDDNIQSTITFSSMNDSVVAIYNFDPKNLKKPNVLYQQVVLGTQDAATIDTTKYGNAPIVLQSDKLQTVTIDPKKRKNAVNLKVIGSAVDSVTATGKADTIDVERKYTKTSESEIKFNSKIGTTNSEYTAAWGQNQVTINSGAGNDTIVVNAGDNFYLADFTVGNNVKKADVIQTKDLGEGKVIGYDGNDVIIGFKGTDTAESSNFGTDKYAAKVVIKNGLWDGAAANKEILYIADDGKQTATMNVGAPDITVAGAVDKNATITVKSENEPINKVTYFNNKGPITIQNKYLGTDGNNLEYVGSKGNDTLYGADSYKDLVIKLDTAIASGALTATWNLTTAANGDEFAYSPVNLPTSYSNNGTVDIYRENGLKFNGDISVNDIYGKFDTSGKFVEFVQGNGDDNSKSLGGSFTVKTEIGDITFTTSSNIEAKNGVVSGWQLGSGFSATASENKLATTLNGGAGNDLIIAGVSGGLLQGDVGNDTLRTGQAQATVRAKWSESEDAYAASTLDGGVGNDYYVITGEGDAVVNYRYIDNNHFKGLEGTEQKKTVADAKKLYGNDQLIFSYDKANAKNPVAQVTINSADVKLLSKDEVLTTYGIGTADAEYAYLSDTHVLKLNVRGYGFTDTVSSKDDPFYHYASGKVEINGLREGTVINAQVGGVKYNQKFSTSDSVKADGNFNGYFAPKAVKITGADKNAVLVGNEKTTEIIGGKKKDTLIANNSSAILTGGESADVFDVTNSYGAVITDYNAKQKDVIRIDGSDIYGVEVSGKDITIGNVVVKDALSENFDKDNIKEITFQYDQEIPTYVEGKNGNGSWKVTKQTDTMVRAFSTSNTASTLSAGAASTYLKVFDGIDDNVKTVKSAGKVTKLDINGNNVNSIVGGAKGESFNIENVADGATIQTGKGDDTVSFYVEDKTITITDWAAATTVKNKPDEYKAGDVLQTNGKLEFGTDGSSINKNSISFDGDDVIINKVRLTKMKDKVIAYTYTTATTMQLFTAVDPHEYQVGRDAGNNDDNKAELKKNAEITKFQYNPIKTTLTMTKNTKGAVADTGKYITRVDGGKGVDTIIAGIGGFGSNENYVPVKELQYALTSAAFDGVALSTGSLTINGGAGADFFVFRNNNISYTYGTFGDSEDTAFTFGSEAYYGLASNGGASYYKSDDGDWYKAISWANGTGHFAKQIITGTSEIHQAVNYVIKDYAGDKIVFDDSIQLSSVSYDKGNDGEGYESTTKKVKGTDVTTNYSDVTLHLSDGNTILIEKQPFTIGSGASGLPVIQIVRASEAGSKNFGALDYGNATVTVGASDGLEFDFVGAVANHVTVASGKAVTLNNTGYSIADNAVATVYANPKSASYVIGNKYQHALQAGTIAYSGINDGISELQNTFAANTALGTELTNAGFTTAADSPYQGYFTIDMDSLSSNYFVDSNSTTDIKRNLWADSTSDTFAILLTTDGKLDKIVDADGFTGQISTASLVGNAGFGSSVFDFIDDKGQSKQITVQLNTKTNNLYASFTNELSESAAMGTDKGIVFVGGSKNDVYVANGASDTIDLIAGGNNTIKSNGYSQVYVNTYANGNKNGIDGQATSNTKAGNDTYIIGDRDVITIAGYSYGRGKVEAGGDDQILLDTVFGGGSLTSVWYEGTVKLDTTDNDGSQTAKNDGKTKIVGDLHMVFTGSEVDGKVATAEVVLKDHHARRRVYIGQMQLTTSAKGVVSYAKKPSQISNSRYITDTVETDGRHEITGILGGTFVDNVEVGKDGLVYTETYEGKDIIRVYDGGNYNDVHELQKLSDDIKAKATSNHNDDYYPDVTIGGFNMGQDGIYIVGDDKTEFELKDYDKSYTYLGGESATLHVVRGYDDDGKAQVQDIVLNGTLEGALNKNGNSISYLKNGKNATDTQQGAQTTPVKIITNIEEPNKKGNFTSFPLHNQQNVVLLAKNANSTYNLYEWGWTEDNMGVTKTFDANKIAKKKTVTVYANGSLTAYTAGAGVDEFYSSSVEGAQQVKYTYKAGDTDEIYISRTSVVTVDGNKSGNSDAVVNFVDYGKNNSRGYITAADNGNELTIDVVNAKKKSVGKINLHDNSADGGVFSYSYEIAKGKDYTISGGEGEDSVKTVADYEFVKYVSGNGLDKESIASDKKTSLTAEDWKNVLKDWEDNYQLTGASTLTSYNASITGSGNHKLGSSYGRQKYYQVSTAFIELGGIHKIDDPTNGGTSLLSTHEGGTKYAIQVKLNGENVNVARNDGYNIEYWQLGEIKNGKFVALGTDNGPTSGKTSELTFWTDAYGNSVSFSSSESAGIKQTYTLNGSGDGLYFEFDDSVESSATFTLGTEHHFATSVLDTVNFGNATSGEYTVNIFGKETKINANDSVELSVVTFDSSALGTTSISVTGFTTSAYERTSGTLSLTSAGTYGEENNLQTWYSDSNGAKITLGGNEYTIKIDSSSDNKIDIDDVIVIGDQTVTGSKVTIDNKEYDVSIANNNAIKLTNSTGVVSRQDTNFTLASGAAYTIKFDTDAYGSVGLGTGFKLYKGTTEVKDEDNDTAGFQFEVSLSGSTKEKETFTLADDFSKVTWNKDVATRTFTLANGTSATLHYGEDVFGNSNWQLSSATGVELESINGGNATFKIGTSANVSHETNFTIIGTNATDEKGSVTWVKTFNALQGSLDKSSRGDAETDNKGNFDFVVTFGTDAFGNSNSTFAQAYKFDTTAGLTIDKLQGATTGGFNQTNDGENVAGLTGQVEGGTDKLGNVKITLGTAGNYAVLQQADTYFSTGAMGVGNNEQKSATRYFTKFDYGEDFTFTTGSVTSEYNNLNDGEIGTYNLSTGGFKLGEQTYNYEVDGDKVTASWEWNWKTSHSITEKADGSWDGERVSIGDYYLSTSARDEAFDNANATEAGFEERGFKEYDIITAPETLYGSEELDEIVDVKADVDVASTDKENAFENKNVLAVASDAIGSNKKKE